MNKIILSVNILALLAISPVGAQTSSTSEEYRAALRDYAIESEDYLRTLKSTAGEIRTWRSIYVSERFDGRLQSLEKTLIQSNQQIIAEVDKAIRDGGLESLDDVLLMRMAQLQFERENLLLSQKMKVYEFQLRAFLAGRAPKAPVLPAPNYKQAVEYAKTLLTRYPRSPLSDKAHYVMAYALEEMGQYDAAMGIYKRFLRRHPFSPLVDEIKWRVAEHYFDTRDLNKAAYYYLDLSQKKSGTYRLKAVYKLGATYFAGHKYEQAGEYFVQLHNETKYSVDDIRENETLYEESLEYLGIIRSFGVKVSLDEESLAEATKRLARAYQRLPNEPKARLVYLDFMKREPYSPRVPPFSSEIIQSYVSDAKVGEADKMRERLVSYLTRTDKWWKANFRNRKATFEAEDVLEEYLLASAQSHAEKGFERNNKAELKLARDQYLKFLRNYPFSKLALRAKFELAQVEYFSGLYNASQESFEYVMNNPAVGQYLDDAAYGYLWSNVKRIKYPMDKETNLEVKRGSAGELLPAQQLSEIDKTFLTAAQVYVSKIPNGARRQRVLYKVAEIHFQNNNFELSQKAIDMILEDKSEITLTTAKALRLSAEIANVKGDWQLVAQRNNELMSLSFSSDTKGMGEVNQVTPGAQALDTAAIMENSGKRLEAAREYDRIAIGLPRAKFSPYSSWKAAQLYRDEGNYKESLDALVRLKGTEYDAESYYLTAANHKSLLNFQLATEGYESFVKKYPRHPWVPEALFASASLRRDLKQYKEAIASFLRYYDYKPVDTVLFESIEILGKLGDIKRAQAVYSRIPKKSREGKIRGRTLLAEAYWRKRNYRVAGTLCRENNEAAKKIKGLSAQIIRSRAVCRYYEASLATQKYGLNDLVKSALSEFSQGEQLDLAARLYTDIGQKFFEQGNITESVKHLELGWAVIKRNPYSDEGRRLYELLLKVSPDFPVHVGLIMNWNLALPNYFQWLSPATQQMVWGNVRSLCEREVYDDCLKQVEDLAKAESSEEMQINRIIAYLRSGYDSEAYNALKNLGEKTGWSDGVVRLAVLMGAIEMIPADRRTIEIPEQAQRVEGLVTRAELQMAEGKLKGALKDLQDAVKEDPENPAPYVSMARLFHEIGHYELAREVLSEGAKNTKSRSGIYGLLLVWDSILRPGTRKFTQETTDQYDARALYGLGLAALISNDRKTFDATSTLIEKRGTWGQDLRYSAALLEVSKANLSIADYKKSSRYVLFKSLSAGDSKDERLSNLSYSKALGGRTTRFTKDFEVWLKR